MFRGEEPRTIDSPSASSEKGEVSLEAPDGGLEAWSVVAGVWCTSFCSFGWLNSVGIFQEYYETYTLKQYSASEIAWIPSLQIFFMLGCGPVVGWIYDRYGPRYLLLGGSFLHVFGVMMASISTHFYSIMLAQGVCSAIGAASIYQPAVSTIGGWFKKRSALAFGVLATGSSIGGVVFPVMISHLIRSIGYGWAMRTAAFIILLLLLIANLTVKCRTHPSPQPGGHLSALHPFKDISFVLLIAGFVLLTFGIFIPINYLVAQATSEGMSEQLAQYLISILNGASFFGRVLSGFLADKLGRFNMFVLMCYLSAVLILGLWLPASGDAATIVFAALFGFSSGGYISLTPALVAQISPPDEIGYRIGVLFGSAAIPGLITSPIAGAVLSHARGKYNDVKIYGGVFFAAGTSLVLLARLMKTGFKPLGIF